MLNFYHRKKKIFVTTSFKVMFSTLSKQDHLERLLIKRMTFQKYLISPFLSNHKHLLLVRDPYTRLESFFKNKFRATFLNRDSNYNWQPSQKVFYKCLGISDIMTYEEKKQLFLNTNFSRFIDILPKVYKDEPHLHPQCYNNYFYNVPFLKLNYHRIIKIENKDDLQKFGKELDLNLSIISNTTKHINEELIWSPRMITIVNTLYKQDFELYEYPFKS